jgi:hypothetical protein
MQTNPVKSTPAEQNEASAKTAPRQSQVPQSSSVPRDKVKLSPQARTQVQGQAQSQQAHAAGKNQDGDSKK